VDGSHIEGLGKISEVEIKGNIKKYGEKTASIKKTGNLYGNGGGKKMTTSALSF